MGAALHQQAVAAIDAGRSTTRSSRSRCTRRDGTTVFFAVDEHPRRDCTHGEAGLAQAAAPRDRGLQHHGGQLPGVNDGAAALCSPTAGSPSRGPRAAGDGARWASVGVRRPRPGWRRAAIPKALDRAGLTIGDVDLWEINEAFASMCVATYTLLGIDEALVNILGSGCSLGHPIAMTGARMVTSLVHELRRRGGGIGVAAMCAGGGM